jgi:hypothetical protein
MNKNNDVVSLRKLSIEVSNECWIELKVGSIRKEISLGKYVADILEKHTDTLKKSK